MKNIKIWYIIGALIFVMGAIGSVLMLRKSGSGTVIVSRDRDVLYKLNPGSYEKSETFEVMYGDQKNTILIENGTVCISYADCPDQTCVKMGQLRPSMPIVCLPHHLVIQYDNTDLLDGMSN